MSRNTTRVYLRDGKVTHLLDELASPNEPSSAVCGRTPWPDVWFGTGSQDEYDTALTLPVCVTCRNRLLNERVTRKGAARSE